MAEIPPPPPGLDLSDNRSSVLIAVQASTFAVAVLIVILRFVIRHFSGAGFWWDDWLVLAATVIGLTIVALASQLDTIFGQHVWTVGYPTQVHAMGYAFADEILYNLLLGVTKLSVLALYWRIFQVTAIRTPIIVTAVIIVCWVIASVLADIFQCQPIRKNFDLLSPGTCTNIQANFLGNSITNIITDVILLILPMKPIFAIQKPRSQQILIAGTFLCGGLVIIISGLRLKALLEIDLHSIDMTWNYTDTWIWSAAEVNVAIISVCLPTLRPLYKFLTTGSFPNLRPTQDRNNGPFRVQSFAARRAKGKSWTPSTTANKSQDAEDGWGTELVPTVRARVEKEREGLR